MKKSVWLIVLIVGSLSCSDNKPESDAFGNFEADEAIISAEAQGKLIEFKVNEGLDLDKNEKVGAVDTTRLHLKKEELLAKRGAVMAQLDNIEAEMSVQLEQKEVLLKDKDRLEKLVAGNAAPEKQLDDVKGKIKVLEKQVKSIRTKKGSIYSELSAIDAGIRQINDQVKDAIIVNPLKGKVLETYMEAFEIVTLGKPLYKIANLDTLVLKVYVSGAQLPGVKLGEEVSVLIDKNEKENQELTGQIIWISDEAEFTPKIIQTKEERVDLVYAVKVKVPNDGRIKIGMPGEVKFGTANEKGS